ncbi:hypothetical protein B0H11DRAFT_2332305 [Mycena galericulata]|nr:hypothetical protein B0H11DRAFT_2332305 [Mycena galericulata]
MFICIGCTKGQHLPLFTQLSTLVVESGSRPFPLSTRLSTLAVESGSWTPSPDPSVPSHSPPGSPPSWSKAGVWVKRESGKHGSNCTIISDLYVNTSSCINIMSILLEAQCVPRWVDMVGKLPAPLSECRVHPIRGPTWRGNFPLHSVNVVSIPLEAQCVPRWVDMVGTFLTVPMNAVSIPLEFQCVPRWESGPVVHSIFSGLDEAEDAPDIRANTFLAEVTEEKLQQTGYGFLAHRQEVQCASRYSVISHGHASMRRETEAELQPYDMLHPDRRTVFFSVLGLQGEEKAGKRGMRTVVNPSYSVFIANRNPEMCPLGALAFYQHYIHDEIDISEKMNIDWGVNKSWRMIRVLHGPPGTPYNEANLYNLYCNAFNFAGFNSRLKAHLPRHLLGYRQEAVGVDAADTSKLGWTRGETYFDTYAPALPKKTILGAAGYQFDEIYDPPWRHVHVPTQFLPLICPKAEEIRDSVQNRENLFGTFGYWSMVIDLRPYAFQCGAAIFQKCPKSALFRLPAFKDVDVQNWMKTTSHRNSPYFKHGLKTLSTLPWSRTRSSKRLSKISTRFVTHKLWLSKNYNEPWSVGQRCFPQHKDFRRVTTIETVYLS